jgi:U3 small nucleolar RNA-associated protein 22
LQKGLPSLESVEWANDGPSALGEAADDYEKNVRASSVGETAQVCTSGSRAHKPPTGAEIAAIRAAQDLFMSSSFKLQVSLVVSFCVPCCLTITSPQIDALLPNIRPKDSRKQLIDKLLFSLHARLSSLPSIEPLHPLAASRALSEGSSLSRAEKRSLRNGNATPLQMISVPYPLPVPTEDANWKVAFEKPANIAIVGSWINNVAVKGPDDEPWVIDVAVEMPQASLFSE